MFANIPVITNPGPPSDVMGRINALTQQVNNAFSSVFIPTNPQIIATRCSIFNSIRQGTAGGRSDVRLENRQAHYLGRQPVSQIRFGIPGFYVKSDSTGEHVLGNDFTWEAALEITSPATFRTLFSLGVQIPNIPSTANGVSAIFSEPPLGINLPAGGSFFRRQGVVVTAAANFIPSSSQQAVGATDTGWISPAGSSQVQGTGAMTNPGGGASFGGGSCIITGIPAAPMASVGFLGDSIADGVGDTVDAFGNMGFIARGLASVDGFPVPWLRETVGGDEYAQNTLTTGPRKRDLWNLITHLVIQLGTNDIASLSVSVATLQTQLTALLTLAKQTIGPYGKPLYTAAVMLMPRTTSTDNWSSAANQTPVAGFAVGGTRDLYNAMLLTLLGQGLLDAVINPNVYVEDPVTHGVWLTNGTANYPTTDGTHPSSALHILAAQAVNAWALTIQP